MSDIELVIEYYGGSLRGSGTNQTMQCLVHSEDHASATVDAEKGVFFCHSCGAKGSAIDLIMLKEGVDYKAAVEFLKETIGGSDHGVRGAPRARKRVPPGQGYVPRYRRKVSAGSRTRREY
jgi:DNA primase